MQGHDQASRGIPSPYYLDCENRAPNQAPGEGDFLWAVRGDTTYLGFREISSSAGGAGDTRPSPHWGSSGARGPTSKEGKQHLGRKREMALLSFVVGVVGGELPLSIEFGAPARRVVRPQHAQRRLSTFAGWAAGEQGSGRQLNSVGAFLLSNVRGGKQSFELGDDVGRKTK